MDFTKESCRDFVKVLASDAPVPGGGGTAALVGSLGMALGNMVGSLTVGKKKYAEVEEEIKSFMERGNLLMEELLDQVELDAIGFEPLAKAYGIDKSDPNREEILEKATVEACKVPIHIMELVCESTELVEEFALKGSRLAVSDAGCAAALCGAALKAASLNVFINTRTLKNREVAEALNEKCNRMLSEFVPRAEKVFDTVRNSLI